MTADKLIASVQNELKLFEEELRQLDRILAAYVNGKRKEKFVWQKFTSLFKKYHANSLIIARFIEFLQLANDEKVIELYSLNDIEKLYNILAKVFKDDVDINVEKFYYLNNIIDKPAKAKKALDSFKSRISEKLKTR